MIKGINRQIIEITNTDNIYYERAFLVVRPEYKSADYHLLKRQAEELVSGFSAPSAIKKTHMIAYWATRIILFAAAGSAATLLIMSCIH